MTVDLIGSDSPYKGCGQITREQFLFYEMRIAARLKTEGLSDEEVAARIVEENLFQFPTERSVRQMTRTCLNRLKVLADDDLVRAIAEQPHDVAKQICLYAMMKQYRLVWDYMVSVIGAKYESRDYSYSRMDVNAFFLRLQEQDDCVASWSDATVSRIKQVLTRILVENDYLDSVKADRLNPVLICAMLEETVRSSGDLRALTAFNCMP